MQSIDSTEKNADGMSEDLVSKKEEINCKNIIKQYKNCLILIILQKKIKENNTSWTQIPDHLYRILIAGGSGSGKTNALLNLINYEPDNDKIFLYAKIHTKKSIKY